MRMKSINICVLILLVVLCATLFISCDRSSDTEGGNYQLSLSAHPASILDADGISTSTILAEVQLENFPCPDSTLVQFITNSGMIDREAFTTDGIAFATLTADTIRKVAMVKAYVELVSDSIFVAIGVSD